MSKIGFHALIHVNALVAPIAQFLAADRAKQEQAMEHAEHGKGANFKKIAILLFLLVGGYYLVTEHRAHLLGWWPILFVLACPLMHLFMHNHGGHDGGSSQPPANRQEGTGHQH